MNIKIALFDADGVTTSPKRFAVDLERDHEVTPDELLPFFQGPFQACLVGKADLKVEIAPYLALWGWQGSVDEFLLYWFRSEHEINATVVKGIERLRSSGVACYLATNQERYRTQYMRAEMGFGNVFNGIYASADAGCKKPSIEFYQKLLQAIDPTRSVRHEEIIFWDDTEANVLAARIFGIQAFQFTGDEGFTQVLETFLV